MQELIRCRQMAHVFLTQLHKLTGKPAVMVSRDAMGSYPADPKIIVATDKTREHFVFHAQPIETSVIEAPRRIVLPR